ncbi:hypothetical protein Plhal304r1_c019g0067241 [Plasmopara halstedii]
MSGMEEFIRKIATPSYLPTLAEVLDGMRWLRQNPALAAGIVVGLSSYSIAKYYEYGEDSDDESDDSNNYMVAAHNQGTQDEITGCLKTLRLNLLRTDLYEKKRFSMINNSVSTKSLWGRSGGLHFDKVYDKEATFSNDAIEQVWSCLHEGECPPGEQCRDPVWGWYMSN